jgi:hypothetical protein
MADNVLDAFWQAPPISRTVAATAFVTSLGVHFGVLPYEYFIHHPAFLFQFPPQPWRLVTSFLITGNGLSLLFDTYFLYQYMSQLEVGNPRFSKKEDLIWYLTFVSGMILVGLSSLLCVQSQPCHMYFDYSCDAPLSLQTAFVRPSYICPDSVTLLQLSRFLKLRKITPAPWSVHHSQLGFDHGVGMVGCLISWLGWRSMPLG